MLFGKEMPETFAASKRSSDGLSESLPEIVFRKTPAAGSTAVLSVAMGAVAKCFDQFGPEDIVSVARVISCFHGNWRWGEVGCALSRKSGIFLFLAPFLRLVFLFENHRFPTKEEVLDCDSKWGRLGIA